MKEPVDHIERPRLPWRDDTGTLTECGLEAARVRTLTRSDFKRRLKEWGQQRTAITTCMTCVQTAQRYGDWETDPRQAISREVAWEGASHGWIGRGGDIRGTRLRDELRAAARLIENHRDEFNELVHRMSGTVDFQAERRKRGRGA